MRTRSGSLAAIMARVPSHPAHSGVLCICAANASSQFRLPTEDTPGSTRQKDSKHCLFNTYRRCKYGAWLAFALQTSAARASILALVLERWFSTARMRTRPLALLPCYSMLMAPETQLLERPRWSITKAMLDGNGSFNGAVGAFALKNNDDRIQ